MRWGIALLTGVATFVIASPALADFQFSQANYPVTGQGRPLELDLGDLNGGGLDIVIPTCSNCNTTGESKVVRLLNQGNGTFGAPQGTDSCNFGYDMVLENFNPGTDANLDALVNCGFMLGDGAGGFATPPAATGLPFFQSTLALAEITASGEPEVIYGGPGGAVENVLCYSSWTSTNLGSGECGNPINPNPPFSAANQPRKFARFAFDPVAVKLDNAPGGHPPRDDIFTQSTEAYNKINIYARDCCVSVGAQQYPYMSWTDTTRTTSLDQPGFRIGGLTAADFNGDGREEVAASIGVDTSPRFDAFMWDPAVGLDQVPKQTPTMMRPEGIAAADFDGDGKDDIVVVSGLGQGAVHRGNGDGTFGAAEPFSLPNGSQVNAINATVAVGDVSGDGIPDIVAMETNALSPDGGVSVLINGTPQVPPTGPPAADTLAPETTIVKGPKAKSSKAKFTYKFEANEPATFQCKIDKKKLKACSSPAKYKGDEGKHKFSVQATDTAGNTDPTPAKDKFKIVRK
jgi:hypothetical protein